MIVDRKTATLFAASLLSAFADAASGGDYTCNVPRALLCEGCASQIAITLAPGGACRISFTPSAAATGAPTGQEAFSLHVEAPAATTGAYRRRAVVPRPRAVARVGATNPRCFVFNGSQYCE